MNSYLLSQPRLFNLLSIKISVVCCGQMKKMFYPKLLFKLVFLVILTVAFAGPEEDEGVRYADRCEACKILATELQDRLSETGKSHDVLEMG